MKEQQTEGKFPALRYRDYRLYFVSMLISNAGSQMQIVALNWHIYLLTHSAFALGLIGLLRFLPIVVFSLIGGTVADSHNRKTILLTTQVTLAILSAILAIATFMHLVSPVVIYTITVLGVIMISFDMPARQALVPSLVERKHLANAMSLNMIMFQTAMVAGPSLAGVIIAGLGVGTVYTINAISFLAVIAALLLMKTSGEIAGKTTSPSLSAILEGLFFVKKNTMIWSTMLLDFFSTFFASATALLPIFAKDILAVGPQGLGLLYAAPGIGAVVAGYALTHIGHIKKQGELLLVSVFFYGVGTILFGISRIFLLSVVALVFVGAGDSISTVIRNTIRQLTTPDYIRGRMTSVNMIFFMGGPQLGDFEAGFLASLTGAPLSVVTGGIGTILVVAIMALTIPRLRNYEVDQHRV